ncbi:MAG: hypothetical protein PHU17_00785 [Candidatus Pacebacteria bacterium]|nr:hypothetical protein [Candidatus Paceibacterota bacterium]MDD4074055.1 hypothetical protein [Candidatus Paceibacterota bacterium]
MKISKILSIIIVFLFAIFILEGFGDNFNLMDSLSHLLLTLVILGITILAWKKPSIGGWIFILLGLSYLINNFNTHYLSLLLFAGIPCLTGILFLIKK